MKLKESVTIAEDEYIEINGLCFSYGMISPLNQITTRDHPASTLKDLLQQICLFMLTMDKDYSPSDFDVMLLTLEESSDLIYQVSEIERLKHKNLSFKSHEC
jgi:hypothetical protein